MGPRARADRPLTALPAVRSDEALGSAIGPETDHRLLREAFGTFATGVVALAAVVDGRPAGLAVSSFTSVSLEPPLVSVNLAHTSSTWPTLRRADRLGITVLGAHHASACRALAGPAESRFTGLAYRAGPTGTVHLEDGLADFECSIHQEVRAGDHSLVLLRLHRIGVRGDGAPLIVHRSAFTSPTSDLGRATPDRTDRPARKEDAWIA